MLVNNPVLSRLAAIGRLYDPLTAAEEGELVLLMSITEEFNNLPDWAQNHFDITNERYELDRLSCANASIVKHLMGEHDQSKHGRNKAAGVAANVDVEGRRFSVDAATELKDRFLEHDEAFEARYQEVKNEIAQDIYGKPLSELDEYESGRLSRSNVEVFRQIDGKWQERDWKDNNWREKGLSAMDITAADSKVAELKENLNSHFLLKDSMGQLAWNEDGTLGPKTIGEMAGRFGETPQDFVTRMVRLSSIPTDAGAKPDYRTSATVPKRDAEGKIMLGTNGQSMRESVLISKEVAEKLHAEDWQLFADAAYPEVIVSNKALRSILASGEFKSYSEVNRPARAGASDFEYKNARASYESVAFGYDNTTSTANRPISGMLTAFTPHSDLLKAYGGTQVVLKPSVLERTTVTPDDSLNSFAMPKSAADFLKSPPSTQNSKIIGAEIQVNGAGASTNRRRSIYNTPEIQVHGKVTTADIAKVVFQEKVPQALATKLNSMNIPFEIIDTVVEE